ncbi:hypothetical protein BDY19DRAFT_990925 [Irpex rosettiformis]|uniref:Uncharacterized protein n=1 Tax=Irpex rosettiformis TaxID=378272 RepID=A0ACB8UCW7_9APHY|nr:hypothetical protein BDY19DRAFT_990925 [Irpex rosettiformis]
MLLFLGLLCVLFWHVCAQEEGNSAVSISPHEDMVADFKTDPADFVAATSTDREDDGTSTAATATPVKKPSGNNDVAENSSATSSTPGSSSQATITPTHDTSDSAAHSSRPTGKGHRPHSGTGVSRQSHQLPHPTIIPSFPSPENPPNHPLPPSHPQSPSQHQQLRSHGLPAVAIAFAVIGGVLAVFLTYMGARCCYSYRRAPPPDRINDVMSRHYLDEELREREREEMQRRWIRFRSSAASPTRHVPPPPPYVPAPSYEDLIAQAPSPPSSPPIQHV